MNKILVGDCLEKLKELEDNSVDSIVTDPPYELGFMGKSWDNTGIANNVEMWKECLRVLKPGGHLLAFSGTRTYHRMASAIEDAGFEVRDMIEWVYSTGFPKSLNIGKAINKIDGVEFESKPADGVGFMNNDKEDGYHPTINQLIQKGESSDRAKQWEGWGTALKPAHEPICMARKPLSEKTVAENCLKWKTGGINIDESRVETQGKDLEKLNSEWDREWNTNYSDYADKVGGSAGFNMDKAKKENAGLTGRFPANLIHDNSEEVRECFPETNPSKKAKVSNKGSIWGSENDNEEIRGHDDNGGNASRFFKSIIYQAKASKSERNKGCDGLEEKQWIDGACVANRAIRPNRPNQNNHPTVKPIALMEYLIKMVTPKGGIVLDPFAGSGSTLVAAKQNGYQYIGIELTEEYIPIIEARLNALKENKLF